MPPCARLLVHTEGEFAVRAVLTQLHAIETQGIAPADVSPAYWRTLGNRLAARLPLPAYTAERHAGWLAGREGVVMTTVPAPVVPPRPRSRGHARIVVATLAAVGFAALAWASFVSPLPRLTYNPSESVAVDATPTECLPFFGNLFRR